MARVVLPHPGGPYNSIERGSFTDDNDNDDGDIRKRDNENYDNDNDDDDDDDGGGGGSDEVNSTSSRREQPPIH